MCKRREDQEGEAKRKGRKENTEVLQRKDFITECSGKASGERGAKKARGHVLVKEKGNKGEGKS